VAEGERGGGVTTVKQEWAGCMTACRTNNSSSATAGACGGRTVQGQRQAAASKRAGRRPGTTTAHQHKPCKGTQQQCMGRSSRVGQQHQQCSTAGRQYSSACQVPYKPPLHSFHAHERHMSTNPPQNCCYCWRVHPTHPTASALCLNTASNTTQLHKTVKAPSNRMSKQQHVQQHTTSTVAAQQRPHHRIT